MKKTNFTKVLSLIVCIVLIAAMALFTTGCNGNKPTDPALSQSETPAPATVLGEGQTTFLFTVIDLDGKQTAFEIHTDKTTVGEALLAEGLIAGEDGTYGLYVKTVNGITLDYNKDKAYWAFYENGAYAMSGVDTTAITAGNTYAFKAEAA